MLCSFPLSVGRCVACRTIVLVAFFSERVQVFLKTFPNFATRSLVLGFAFAFRVDCRHFLATKVTIQFEFRENDISELVLFDLLDVIERLLNYRRKTLWQVGGQLEAQAAPCPVLSADAAQKWLRRGRARDVKSMLR